VIEEIKLRDGTMSRSAQKEGRKMTGIGVISGGLVYGVRGFSDELAHGDRRSEGGRFQDVRLGGKKGLGAMAVALVERFECERKLADRRVSGSAGFILQLSVAGR
jgi:hypothetical protein